MHVFELLLQFAVAALIAFLAFTHDVATTVDRTVAYLDGLEERTALRDTFHVLVGDQLRSNPAYQQAAVVESEVPVPAEATLEEALVNVYCTVWANGAQRNIVGSGVFIDSRGVILTNAHLAQFLLLEEENEEPSRCVIRTGSPAAAAYEAEVLYVSPVWIAQNAHQLYADRPIGTGERDFALLYVTRTLAATPATTFPALPFSSVTRSLMDVEVLAAGYPAPETVSPSQEELFSRIATTSVAKLFTFSENGPVDLVSVAPSEVGYHGSSGGPLVDEDGRILGLIVTRGNVEAEGERSLRAITIPYISRALEEETGLDLRETLTGDLELRARTFRETVAPNLRALLAE